ARLVARDPATKAYSLGPELVMLGFAAQDGFTALQVARRHADRLAVELELSCTVSAVVDDVHVVLARSGPREVSDPTVRIGQRFPFAPPWGTANVAWDTDEVVDAWLAKDPVVPGELDLTHLGQIVAAARHHGFLVEVASEVGLRLNASLAHLTEGNDHVVDLVVQATSSLGYRHYLTDGLDDDATYDVAMIGAPTFDADGRQELLVALFGFRHLGGRELRAKVDRLVAATAEITDAVGGTDPWAAGRPRPGSPGSPRPRRSSG
ncbi:MAG: hypothetical protein JWO68_2469, partial [Actinomycetia bacterium]|nr:hypothetical protein [Actinomycetes bacterium]